MKFITRILRPEQVRELVTLFLIVIIVLGFGTLLKDYYTGRTFVRVSTSIAIIAVVAMAQTLVAITRNIDLSLGAIVGFCAFFLGVQLSYHHEIGPVPAALIAIAIGTAMGMINGLIIAYGRVPAIITTIGTMAIYRTAIVLYSAPEGGIVSAHRLPMWARQFASWSIFKVGDLDFRVMVGIAIAVVILIQLMLTYLPYGRRLYAIGSNPEAARIAGFPAQRIVFIAYLIGGALAGLGGYLFLLQYGNLMVLAGVGLEFDAVAAAVVGGVNIFGGTGTAIGAFLGATLIGTLDYSLRRWPAISEFWRNAILGLLILLAVATDSAIMARLRLIWARAAAARTAEMAEAKARSMPQA
jgi:rhamnose transport system permease protein